MNTVEEPLSGVADHSRATVRKCSIAPACDGDFDQTADIEVIIRPFPGLERSLESKPILVAAATASPCLRPALFARQRYPREGGLIYPAGRLDARE